MPRIHEYLNVCLCWIVPPCCFYHPWFGFRKCIKRYFIIPAAFSLYIHQVKIYVRTPLLATLNGHLPFYLYMCVYAEHYVLENVEIVSIMHQRHTFYEQFIKCLSVSTRFPASFLPLGIISIYTRSLTNSMKYSITIQYLKSFST